MRSPKRELWNELTQLGQSLRHSGLTFQNASVFSDCGLMLDINHQKLDEHAFEKLLRLCELSDLRDSMLALKQGKNINFSENRPALHTALRAGATEAIWVHQRNIMEDVEQTRQRMKEISQKIRTKTWYGRTGKPILDIVNIGIGGSDLGPRFCIEALESYQEHSLSYHFVSDVDPTHFESVIRTLNPDTTLFIIVSKSFTTVETLYNANKAIAWMGGCPPHHFIAVTAAVDKAHALGIQTVLPIWDWVGGRFSFCSAVNLISAIAVGYENFEQILKGAQAMDSHFFETPFERNMPVILALMGIWNNNFLQTHQLLLLIYAHQLERFVSYVQQLDMESNGKSINHSGEKLNYSTAPIVWGGLGNQAQHSYYQLLCQGTHQVAIDFISLKNYEDELINQMCEAKMQVLSQGIGGSAHPEGLITGGIAFNHLQLNACTPFSLGALIALYEHKIFTQGIIWEINSFDQPGVEAAKRARKINQIQEEIKTLDVY